MDGYPPKAIHFCLLSKDTGSEEETTDNISADLKSEEKMDNNSTFLEISPIPIEDSCSGSFIIEINKTHEVPKNWFQETLSQAKTENPPRYSTLPSLLQSCRRKKERQEEIAFGREYRKLEKVWINRGLPVDRESLCAAASKDAFDMRGLNESLPSTSAKEPVDDEFRRMWHVQMESFSRQRRQHLEKFERFKNYSLSSYTPRLSRMLPSSTSPPIDWDLPMESDTKSALFRPAMPWAQRKAYWNRRRCSHVLSSQLEKTPTNDEQKETSEDEGDNSDVEKALHNWACQGKELNKNSDLNVKTISFLNTAGSAFVGKPLGEKEEKQNSDVESNLQNVGFAPVPKLHQDMNQCSGWDPEKKWIAPFQFPGISAQFKSSNKKGNFEPIKPTWSMAEVMTGLRQRALRNIREQSKLRTMNSRRGVLSGDMNESETESPSIKMDTIISPCCDHHHHNRHISAKKSHESFLDQLKSCKHMLMQARTSAKNIRSFKSRFATGIQKSDKVVPD